MTTFFGKLLTSSWYSYFSRLYHPSLPVLIFFYQVPFFENVGHLCGSMGPEVSIQFT